MQESGHSSSSSPLPLAVRALYPYRHNYHLLADGSQMHHVDEGDGEAVLMLHGNPTWSFFYRGLIDQLSESFRCIAPDHIGCGLSSKPQDYAYTLAQHIGNVRQLITSLGIQRFHLIVHDWGGAIGFGVATAMPEAVLSLTVMNTAAFRSKNIPKRINACRIPGLGAVAIRGFNGFAGAAIHMAVEKPLPADVRTGYLFPYNNWANRIATLRFVQDIPLSPSHRSYATLQAIEEALPTLSGVPMHLCWGMRDWCFGPTFLREWQTRFPRAVVDEFPHAGHYLMEDEPEVIPCVARFISGI